MVMPASKPQYASPEAYLEQEIVSEERHEYIDGEIVPMAGGTPNHNQILLNLAGALNFELRRQPYRVFVTDQRLWIPERQIYTYPDVMVVQGELQFQEGRRDTLTNPVLIAEVLSGSTANYDRSEKFAAYRTIPEFREYLAIDQSTMHVEHYLRTEPKRWIFSEYDGEGAIVGLESVPFQISLADLYDEVAFEIEETD